MSSANSENFTSSFQSRAFYFIFLPISLPISSSTVLNRSGKGRHLCLILDFRGKTFSLSLLCMMLTVFFLVDVLCISFLWLMYTNYHTLCSLKQCKYIISQSGGQKSKIKLRAWPCPFQRCYGKFLSLPLSAFGGCQYSWCCD